MDSKVPFGSCPMQFALKDDALSMEEETSNIDIESMIEPLAFSSVIFSFLEAPLALSCTKGSDIIFSNSVVVSFLSNEFIS